MQIIIDSTSDISFEEAKKLNIHYIPMILNLNEKEYLDGIEITKDEFYERLENEKLAAKTSQPSPNAFLEIFEKAKNNNEEVICLLISSKLSGTYRSAIMAKEMIDYERIHIIDTLSVSVGIKFMLDELIKNITLPINELLSHIEKMREKIVILAGLDTLEYLHRGGRLSRSKFILGNILNMKPIITVQNGAVEPYTKALGITRAYITIEKYIRENPINHNYKTYFGYTKNKDKMQGLINKLGITNYEEIHVGTAIGTHTGPNAYAIFYIKADKWLSAFLLRK